MFTPKIFTETDLGVLHSLITSHPLGTWITTNDDVLDVNHIPFVLDPTYGDFGVLRGHINRANPVCKSLLGFKESIVVFQGAESYISPSWYPSKEEHGKAVPTWNYVVLHAYGVPQVMDDKDWLYDHLNTLTDQQEAERDQPWKVADAPDDYLEKMVGAIVGIQIPINKLCGTWKTSQNKQAKDKHGIIKALSSSQNSVAREMGLHVSQHTERTIK